MSGFFTRLDAIPFSAVEARVAYQLIIRDFRINPENYRDPADGVRQLGYQLEVDGFRVLACWVTSYAYHMHRTGLRTKVIRDWLIDRSVDAARNRARGEPWRRAKPSCPPVSNTGAAMAERARLERDKKGNPQ